MNPDKFARKTNEALAGARELAMRAGHAQFTPLHLAMALLSEPPGIFHRAINNVGGEEAAKAAERVFNQALMKLPSQSPPPGEIPASPSLIKVIGHSQKSRGDSCLAVDRLIIGLLEDSQIGDLLKEAGVATARMKLELKRLPGKEKVKSASGYSTFGALEAYGRDLVEQAGKLDPVIGRDEEIKRVVGILSKRTKNNAVLIGQLGVGKIAIVEGLAERIARGDVPSNLRGVRLIVMDMDALVTGVIYGAIFEERLEAVLKEVEEAEGKVILFIDEIHLLLGAGHMIWSMGAANLFKPMLARGRLRCIGATTLEEYKECVETDAALLRRFQQVHVAEPVLNTISRGLKDRREGKKGKKVGSAFDYTTFGALEAYGRDLVEQAGKVDLVIGRDEEIKRVVGILSKRTKNNAVLIGQLGVGKTAIVEGLAERIARGDVPSNLRGIRLIAMDMDALVTGVIYGAIFEERLEAILKEVEEAKGKVILFIDEIHLLLGAGHTIWSMGAANLFKPMLARGQLRCIGATTLEEYKECVETDAALLRRFQRVHVAEPSVPDTISRLNDRHEGHHGVRIRNWGRLAARLCSRYITGGHLSHKAIDSVDEGCANVRVQLDSQPEEIDNLMRKRMQLEVELDALEKEKDKASQAHLVEVREELDDLREKLEPLMKKYKKKKERINEIKRLRQKREELMFGLQEAQRRYDLARAAELRYSAIEANIEEGPGNSSKVVRFWDGEHEAIIAGSVEVSQGLMDQVKELNDLKDKLRPRIMTFWKKKVRIDEIRQFKQKVGDFLSLQKDVKFSELVSATKLRYLAIQKVEAAITQLEGNTKENLLLTGSVGPEHIDEGVSSWTGIPVSRLGQNEKERLAGLAERLHQKVVGQDQAVRAVAEAVLRSRAGLGGPQQPTSSFLFLGPTGVGKTELAKALAEELFDDENPLIRINMSEYVEQHSVSRLISAPHGYVRHEVGGQLNEAVRGRPYSVVLFDWVEKAHMDVMDKLLKVLEEGRLTDGQGRTVDFWNTIIMTSNLGAKHLLSGLMGECTMEVARDRVMQEVRCHFKPELLNLLDEIIVFDPLSHEQLRKVARLQMKDAASRLAKRGVALAVTDAALDSVLAESCDPVNGAWPIRRFLEKKLVTKLSEILLMEEIDEYSTVYIDAGPNGQDLVYRVEKNGGFVNAVTWQKSNEDGRC